MPADDISDRIFRAQRQKKRPGRPPTATSLRWFAPSSPLNVKIADLGSADKQVDPNSPAMISSITNLLAQPGHSFVVSIKYWTVPVYYADANTPKYDVLLDSGYFGLTKLKGVPIPNEAQPDPGGDAHMCVINTQSGCYWEFLGANKVGSSWHAWWAQRGLIAGSGIDPGGQSSRASGFANIAGLLRPEEFQARKIEHALSFGIPYTKAGGPVPPATKSDGGTDSETGARTGSPARPAGSLPIPEGARIRVDPALDLGTLGLSSAERMIAECLQVYGMFNSDTSGNLTLYAQNPQSYATNPWPAIFGYEDDYAFLNEALADHFQVLKLPGQIPNGNSYTASSPCGAFV